MVMKCNKDNIHKQHKKLIHIQCARPMIYKTRSKKKMIATVNSEYQNKIKINIKHIGG